jgi:hypothetical protein
MTTNTATTIDTDGDIAYATPVRDMVCNALVSREGVIHYAPDSEHETTAMVLGFADLETALRAGLVYVSLSGLGYIEARRHPTDAQLNALWDMWGFASNGVTVRCKTYCKALTRFADDHGLA